MFATSGTYLWSFVTQIFHSSQPSHGDDRNIFEVMTSTIISKLFVSILLLILLVAYADWLFSLMHNFQSHDIPIGVDVCSNSWEHISRSGEVSVFNIWEHMHELCLSILCGFIIGLYSWFYMTEFGLICEHTFETRLYSHILFHNVRILKLILPRYSVG